jgi:uncharacterized membrane protein
MRPKTDWVAVLLVTFIFALDLGAWVGILAALGLL